MAKRINLDIASAMDNKTATLKPKKTAEKKAKNNFDLIEDYLLENHKFRLNEISVTIESASADSDEWDMLNENNLYYHLYKAGFKGFQNIVQTLLKNDYTRERFNPFKSYFNGLEPWKEDEGDLINKLSSYIEVEPQNKVLFAENFKKMLVRTAACALNRIPFNKQCFILQGKQNDGKSTFVRNLIPKELQTYYTDSFDPENKDDIKRIATCLIINIDEMASLSRRDINKIKSIISMPNVVMRLPYDARDSNLPRVASFFGTTNEDEFLTDATGSVRWIVFKVLNIQHDNGGENGYNSIDINRVWAQAMHLLNSGYDFKLSEDELKEVEMINRSYQVTTLEAEYVMRYFEPDSAGEVLTSSEMIEYIRSQHRDLQLIPIAIGKALTFLKFERGQRYNGRFQVKGYKVKKIDVYAPPSVPSDQITAAAATSYRVDKRLMNEKLKKENDLVVNKTQKELTESDLPF